MKYDYLVVGAGLFGSVFAHEANKCGRRVLVIDRRSHIAGNTYTKEIEKINVHTYGAHIFHTNNREVWDYVNRFAAFNRFTNSPIANYKGELYSLPFSMYTFNQMWGVTTPEQARKIIDEQKKACGITTPRNLEEQAISMVGSDIYHKLIKGYTEKQWGRPCTELPPFIIKRLPVRFTFDNNYFNALYQGVPIGGYTKLVANMLDGVEFVPDVDYLKNLSTLRSMADKVIFTGCIDEYYRYDLGVLQYRSTAFNTEILDVDNLQGNAVINYTDSDTKYTRVIEHKWFEFGCDTAGNKLRKTVISREYSKEWERHNEPYYPINDAQNNQLYLAYRKLAAKEKDVIFGGRLGEYRYYDMDQVVESSLRLCRQELNTR